MADGADYKAAAAFGGLRRGVFPSGHLLLPLRRCLMYHYDEPLRRLLSQILVIDGRILSPNALTWGDIISMGMLVISFFGFTAALIGILFTYMQVKQNNKVNRAMFLKEFYTTMFTDEDIRKVWYMVEYNRFIYEGTDETRDECFHESELEKATDRLLTFVDLLCSLHARNVISDDEMGFFKYEIRQMYTNEDLDRYLRHVQASYKKIGLEPYKSYFQYCEKNFTDRQWRPKGADLSPAQPDDSYFVVPIEKAKNLHIWLR
jgi:hypothetical protein